MDLLGVIGDGMRIDWEWWLIAGWIDFRSGKSVRSNKLGGLGSGVCDCRSRLLACPDLKGIISILLANFGLVLAQASDREPWDHAEAKKMVAKVLEVEKAGKLPWNRIPWRIHVENAVKEARETGKPLFVFFYVPQGGPPTEPCGLEGRLLRVHGLSDSKVVDLVKAQCVPVKIQLVKGQDCPVEWAALKKWATAYKFSNGRGFTGCSVVSSDLAIEYGNSGSARLSEMLESPAFDAKAILAMLVRAMDRVNEERSIRVQRRISDEERELEIARFRKGVTRAVQSEGRRKLPPEGYSLEQALELYRMAGIED